MQEALIIVRRHHESPRQEVRRNVRYSQRAMLREP